VADNKKGAMHEHKSIVVLAIVVAIVTRSRTAVNGKATDDCDDDHVRRLPDRG